MFSGCLACLSLPRDKDCVYDLPKTELSESKQTGTLINANQQFILTALGQHDQPTK